ncbi:hemicentin-1-like [Maniola jurtina]|uniref:hemicentin-1-like n=1 Tax=Maniola jurtina TaxID=191418 RepID=UPI001E68A101|nr:hemicentin-1-like [Maniola jurtina]
MFCSLDLKCGVNMVVTKKIYTLIAFLVLLSFASGDEAKGSLTFVIDDTNSMDSEINQVKEKTNEIFAAVLNSNATQIDEFIIVTFNDPHVKLRVKSNKRGLFTRALTLIQPKNGDDCPEMAMTGIQLALEESKRNSFLYVFTDASAKDYDQYENVKSLAQQKSIQVNFLLTGECQDSVEERHTVYDHLATATSGQVFHIDKDEISKIIEYILANLRNRRINLLHKTYEYTRRCDNLKFTVDSKVWEVLIALSASRPLYYSELKVYGPGGTEESIQIFINTDNTQIFKMHGKPGDYVTNILDCEGITVVVSASTSVSFRHGFSSVKPRSLDETSTKPIAGKESYLAIALTNEDRDITLKTVEIRDTDDNLIPPPFPLTLVDDEKQFYTTDLFTPPKKTFTIAVIGFTKSNEKITRVSQTSIEYHTPLPPVLTPPTVTILGPKDVPGDNNKAVYLKCKVTGYPEPKISWENKYSKDFTTSKTYEIAPNEFMNVLHVGQVSESVTFTCKARNFQENSDSVTVTVENKSFLNVLEYPTDRSVEFGDFLELNLKIDANPPATIIWYKDGAEINSNYDMEIITSSQGSSLRIKSAKPSLEGKYFVIASNGHTTDTNKKYEFKITVTIKEKAAIVTILEGNKVTVYEDQPITLNCKVEGFPEPIITWEDQYQNVLSSKTNGITPPYEYISTLHINKATGTDSGTYICKASNFKDDSGSVKVNVIKKSVFNVLEYPKDTSVEYGKSVELNFKIDAHPPAKIIWYLNGKEIRNDNDFDISLDSSVLKIKNAQLGLQGKYYVTGSNGDEQEGHEFHVTVTGTEEPKIYKHINSYTKYRGSSVDIECRIIQGKPEPVISWSFDRNFLGKFTNLKETREIIHIDHVTNDDVGIYRCDVSNVVGPDHHEMLLYIEYPPTVKVKPSRNFNSKKGERVKLACEVDGSPTPDVRWFVNNMEILGGTKYKIYRDHTLSFTGSIGDYGKYVCEASNYLKKVRAEVNVFIYEPTKIETPKESKFDNIKLRSNLILTCNVKGFPKPKVQWFHLTSLKSAPKKINCDKNYNVVLDKIQAEDGGFYRCTADNGFDNDEIMYTVNVPVPVTIVPDFLMTKDLTVVEGDLSFVLTCIATGSPKPDISWQHDGIKIGNDGIFKISNDGTLTVNNVVSRHSGTYTCTAENKYNKDTMNYDVLVNTFPTTNEIPLIITIIEGEKSHDMYCGLYLDSGFVVRWFKDGKFIKEGDLILTGVTKAHAGYYICRVSTPGRSYTFPKKVIVGTGPKFITAASPTVMFKDGAEAKLDCSATGEPPPTTTWWRDYTKINVGSSQYSFRMDVNNIGHIICHVSNEFDTIKRSFDFIAEECLMDIENDFTARQPILISGYKKRQWPVFKVSGGTLRMHKHEEFTLFCPNSFISYAGSNYGNDLKISCAGDSMFELRKTTVNASEITCNQPVFPLARNISDRKCLGHDTKLIHVGFDVDGASMNVFRICFSETTNITLYVIHSIHKAIAATIPKNVAGYTKGTKLRFEFEDIYDCRNQVNEISQFTGKAVSDNCCFKRRQLVNPMDVLPGISQVATYHYLNVVPQWNSCSTENWDEVERRVRSYALNLKDEISLWTGAAYSVRSNIPTLNLRDKLGQELQVPQFIWRVVDRQLAIIHVNIPGLTSAQISSYILCYDICDTIDWMKNPQWHDVDKGFIYCCDVDAFENAFNYQGIFYKNRF